MSATANTGHPVVYVVDDEEGVRHALTRLFVATGHDVRTFPSAKAFLDTYPSGGPGCLVLDLLMPGMGGTELLRELNRRRIDLPVIMLTGHGDIKTAVQAIKAGAVDFIEKPVDNEALVGLVHDALGESARRRSQTERENDIRDRLARLTPRERKVLELIVAGELSKRIAHILGVSEKTIEFHRAKIMKKVQARSLADLVRKSVIGGID